MSVQILQGDVREQLATLPAESVQVCVTSPPYYSLRAYSTAPQVWGGDPEHGHEWESAGIVNRGGHQIPGKTSAIANRDRLEVAQMHGTSAGASCPCGAWRGELGSEPTPALFIEHLVSIFDEVARVMRPDGVVFCNLGDSYSGSGKGPSGKNGISGQEQRQGFHDENDYRGIPAKNLLLIPERFALAMHDRGWIVRSRIAWCKTSAMPESVRDRPTSAWEHIYMFTRSQRYFYDADAVRTAGLSTARPESSRWDGDAKLQQIGGASLKTTLGLNKPEAGANLRNFWLLGPEPSREQHYAAFPSEIPRRCILAATSEKGQCPACGAPWVRMTEKRGVNGYGYANGPGGHQMQNGVPGQVPHRGLKTSHVAVTTLGWASSCGCNADPPIPQLVLDPFLGSGTTALVADQLGRNAVGIELNQQYVEIARRRITNDCPMFTDVEVTA